jgi:hypothetical protein
MIYFINIMLRFFLCKDEIYLPNCSQKFLLTVLEDVRPDGGLE